MSESLLKEKINNLILLYKKGLNQEAQIEAQKLIKSNPSSFFLHNILGMVNSILGAIQLTEDQTCSADMNGDGFVNVMDITIVVNIILNGE